MLRFILIAGLTLTLQACARGNDTEPSFLGAALLGDEAEAAPATTEPHPELRHIGSNKVLGAMAFQKVTGRPVDPSRLQNSR